MKKSDLKTGMKVVCNDGTSYIVLLGVRHNYFNLKNEIQDILVDPVTESYDWLVLDHYSDDLYDEYQSKFNIKQIYIPNHPYDIFYINKGWKLIWEREEEKVEPLNITLNVSINPDSIKDVENVINELKSKLSNLEIEFKI